MTKTDLINVVAEKADLTKKDADAAVKAVVDAITEALANGDKVQLLGFGTFEARERGERECRNPRTGEAMKVDACKVPAFKASSALKNAIN